MSQGPLKRSSGNEATDAALKALKEEHIEVRPVELESGKGSRLGDTKFLMVSITFNVDADIEVQVPNPLDYVPTIYFLANLLDHRPALDFLNPLVPLPIELLEAMKKIVCIYMDADKAGVVDPCTWTDETLGFKCSIDTSADALTVKVIIA